MLAWVRDTLPRQRKPETSTGGIGDLRMVPVAVAGWVGAVVGVGGPTWLAAGCGMLGFGLVVGGRLRRHWLIVGAGVIVVAVTAAGLGHQHRMSTGPVADLARAEAMVVTDVRTDTDPHPGRRAGRDFLTVRATVSTIEGRGRSWRVSAPVLLIVSGEAHRAVAGLPVGSMIRIRARLRPAEAGDDIAAVLPVSAAPELLAGPSSGLAMVERVRAGLRAAVADRTEDQRALVPALVLGDTSRITPELTAVFERTGLTHLTAVSGANLTLLLAFLLLLARWIGVRGWALRLVGLAGVIIFVALCRTEPSVLRAAAMGLVALAALGAGGRDKGLRNLSVAVVALLLLDPALGRSAGFALSVLASAGIVIWAGRWADVIARRTPRIVAESIAVPLAAHLATLPVVTVLSETVSVVGVVANALAGPFVGPATVFGFAAAGLSLLHPWPALAAGLGAAWLAQPILWVAHAGSGLPGAAWPWPTHPVSIAVLSLAGLGLAWLMPRLLARRLVALAALAIMLIGFLRPPVQPGWPPAGWAMVACDVGQGDGLIIDVGGGQAVVVDVGPEPRAIDACLDQLGVRAIPLLILSHFHSDHVDGLVGVFDQRPVGEIWVSPSVGDELGRHHGVEARTGGDRHRGHDHGSGSVAVTEVVGQAEARGVPIRTPTVGEVVEVGDTTWRVLGPIPSALPNWNGDEGESAAENDASLSLIATVAGVRILFTGDLEPGGQRALLASGADLRADVLKVPHHGSARQDRDFLAATGARVAVASAGRDNDYGHPAPRTVALLESLGMTVLSTDRHGSVAITVDGTLAATTQRRPRRTGAARSRLHDSSRGR